MAGTSEASIVALPHIKPGGKFKALTTTWVKRISVYPELSTAKEQGFPDRKIAHWAGIHAPAGVPADTMDKLAVAVNLPIIVDADTGFGNAVNVRHTVRTLERAGANAIQLEDQVMPKKCGHFAGKDVIAKDEMIGKIKAAVDARQHPDFLIIARADARAVFGLNDALERAAAFAEHGADMTFVEAPVSIDELRRIAAELTCPQIVNVVIGGKTPALPAPEFAAMGFGLVLYANAALQGAGAEGAV